MESRLRQWLARNTPDTPDRHMRPPGFLAALLCVLEVQQDCMEALRSRDFDVLIVPDTSAIPFVDFTKATEPADAGEAAAEKVLPSYVCCWRNWRNVDRT
jgi:NTE family protein